jgi:hypothetical protein
MTAGSPAAPTLKDAGLTSHKPGDAFTLAQFQSSLLLGLPNAANAVLTGNLKFRNRVAAAPRFMVTARLTKEPHQLGADVQNIVKRGEQH